MIQLGGNAYLERCLPGDERWPVGLLKMAEQYHDEVLPMWEYDEEMATAQIGALIENPMVRMWTINKDDIVIGVVAFCVTYPIAGGPKEAIEVFWYILPEHRGSSVAFRAMRKAEEYLIREDEVCSIEMTAMESSMVGKVEGYLIRSGYVPSERHYRKTVGGVLDRSGA